MLITIPTETAPGETRVAATPDSAAKLLKLGHQVTVQAGAGAAAGFSDAAYRDAGVTLGTDIASDLAAADLVLKVRTPTDEEIAGMKRGAIVAAFLRPASNAEMLDKLAAAGVTGLSLESVPRITRAQSIDSLSAMANIAGYRAVIEAANSFGRFMGGQMTAAGMLPPAKVLIIGAGVAGLAALGAAKSLGAIVRAFDTRSATKEQVESLGGEFLTVELEETGEGAGGYAREMSEAFIEAEFALFREQAEQVDIVITTALIPGKPAPKLWLRDMVERMKPGSVVVDLAGEQGGNCECTTPGEAVTVDGVKVLGYLNLPSRMPDTASSLYANILVNLVKHLGAEAPKIDMSDEITRAITVTHDGAVTWPPPTPPAPPAPAPKPAKPVAAAAEEPVEAPAWLDSLMIAGGLLLVAVWVWLRFTWGAEPGSAGGEALAFVQHLTVFVMACFVGWQVIWNVSPALHTPLMAVTNAISGIIILGGLLTGGAVGEGGMTPAVMLGLLAVLLAMINVAGGFLVTHRMLAMFRRG
ncbi:Re/Si-specific NAD(P)(+) transhydrogenase subunit alpha [Pseudobythopirellula maris]|uniref:Re/Si-specific NAD(P)(+) transhydrogenase subunit alpha n=1 Tax=Pseudobythopirellula maris TaxID=2527991 RepID=UPI0018D2FCB1|nr:Re/Si-specific NAD(P)(+) transhydrogenase subunit alpha [Pseudobythopirellula maris]